MKNYWKKCLCHLKQNDLLPKESYPSIIQATSKHVFGFIDGNVWKIDLEKMMTNEEYDNDFKTNEEMSKMYDHLHILLLDSYMDTVRELFQEAITNYNSKYELNSSQNSIEWRITSARISQQEYVGIQKELLKISTLFGFIYLSFEVRQFIYNPIKWIRDIGKIYGDTSSFSNWTYEENPTLMILMILFAFFMAIYILNVFITLFSEATVDHEDSFLITRAESIILSIDLSNVILKNKISIDVSRADKQTSPRDHILIYRILYPRATDSLLEVIGNTQSCFSYESQLTFRLVGLKIVLSQLYKWFERIICKLRFRKNVGVLDLSYCNGVLMEDSELVDWIEMDGNSTSLSISSTSKLPLISNATDVGILHIEAMKRFTRNLHILSLSKTRIKNESLRIIGNSAFSHIRSLKYLKVGYNCVTDKGVKELEGLSKLTFLNLDYTKVSLSCKQILSCIYEKRRIDVHSIIHHKTRILAKVHIDASLEA
uniref:RNI-like protein n=1 Tax=Rhizophagus irregularis (strain DAOM 181602 / DAOM 197198 / MUCL 43194) TaxID=747089 RepID=U9T209_RHIID